MNRYTGIPDCDACGHSEESHTPGCEHCKCVAFERDDSPKLTAEQIADYNARMAQS